MEYINVEFFLIFACSIIAFYFILKNKKGNAGFPENHGHVKAAKVMTKIFQSMIDSDKEETLMIYAKNMNGEISGFEKYYDTLTRLLLEKKHKITILLDEHPEFAFRKVNAYNLLKSYSEDPRVEVFLLDPIAKSMMNTRLKNVYELYIKGKKDFDEGHFAVSTTGMFRLEFNQEDHLAHYSHNIEEIPYDKAIEAKDTEIVDILKNIFETIPGREESEFKSPQTAQSTS